MTEKDWESWALRELNRGSVRWLTGLLNVCLNPRGPEHPQHKPERRLKMIVMIRQLITEKRAQRTLF